MTVQTTVYLSEDELTWIDQVKDTSRSGVVRDAIELLRSCREAGYDPAIVAFAFDATPEEWDAIERVAQDAEAAK